MTSSDLSYINRELILSSITHLPCPLNLSIVDQIFIPARLTDLCGDDTQKACGSEVARLGTKGETDWKRSPG